MCGRIVGADPSLCQLLEVDPVIEIGHVEEHGDDRFFQRLVVFRDEGSTKRYLQTLSPRDCSLPWLFFLQLTLPLFGVVISQSAP